MKRRLRCHSSFSLVLAVGTDSCSAIEPTEEAVAITLGTVDEVSSQSVYVPSTYGLKTGVQ